MPLIVGANAVLPLFVTHKFWKCSNSEFESDNKCKENPRCVFFISFVNLHFMVKT